MKQSYNHCITNSFNIRSTKFETENVIYLPKWETLKFLEAKGRIPEPSNKGKKIKSAKAGHQILQVTIINAIPGMTRNSGNIAICSLKYRE